MANATPSALDASYGSEVTLTCIPGHRFFMGNQKYESRSMTCLSSTKRWSPILQACERKYGRYIVESVKVNFLNYRYRADKSNIFGMRGLWGLTINSGRGATLKIYRTAVKAKKT